MGIGGGRIGGVPPGKFPAGATGGTGITGLGTTTGCTVWPLISTTGIVATGKPGDTMVSGVTTTGVPEIVVVKGGGKISLIGVGGGSRVHGILHETVGLGTSHIHGGRGTRFEGWSREPPTPSPVHPTIVPRKPSMLSRARISTEPPP